MSTMIKMIFICICLNNIILTFELTAQSLDNLDKITGYKNFKFGLGKEQFNSYNLLKYDDSYAGFVKEYGTNPYIILKYNGKMGEFSIPYIILHFIDNKLSKITLGVEGEVEEVQKFLIHQFDNPNIKYDVGKKEFSSLGINTDDIDAEWKGGKINLRHQKYSIYTTPRTELHEIIFSLNNYEELSNIQKTKIYDEAYKDFFDSKPKNNSSNQNNSIKFGFDIGDRIENIPGNYSLLGISSKDNSKIYRYDSKFPTTVFSYTVDKFEIKVWNNTVVSLHLVLFPKDDLVGIFPLELLTQIKVKSGTSFNQIGNKYYFYQNVSQTVVFRETIDLYSGDRIHIMTTSTDYLTK